MMIGYACQAVNTSHHVSRSPCSLDADLASHSARVCCAALQGGLPPRDRLQHERDHVLQAERLPVHPAAGLLLPNQLAVLRRVSVRVLCQRREPSLLSTVSCHPSLELRVTGFSSGSFAGICFKKTP